jgi:hypothetical protein
VVCGGIHMSDIPSFPYAILWGERTVRSVANLTRADGEAFLETRAARTGADDHRFTYALQRGQRGARRSAPFFQSAAGVRYHGPPSLRNLYALRGPVMPHPRYRVGGAGAAGSSRWAG